MTCCVQELNQRLVTLPTVAKDKDVKHRYSRSCWNGGWLFLQVALPVVLLFGYYASHYLLLDVSAAVHSLLCFVVILLPTIACPHRPPPLCWFYRYAHWLWVYSMLQLLSLSGGDRTKPSTSSAVFCFHVKGFNLLRNLLGSAGIHCYGG